MQLSLQLYTLRRKARANLPNALMQASLAGYDAVEAARLPLNNSTMLSLQKAQEKLNLQTFSFQLKYKQIADTSKTITLLQKIGCKVAVVSVLPYQLLNGSSNDFLRFCNKLNLLGAVYQKEGIALAFHHHNFEAMPFGDESGFKLLDKGLDYSAVKLVCDTFWLQKSGFSPQQFIKAHSNAIIGLHLRDYTVKRFGILSLPKAQDCPLGQGNLDFNAIINAAYSVNAAYCAVEQNSDTPIKDIKISADYIKPIIQKGGNL